MPKIIVQFGGEEWSVDLREGVNVAGRSPQAAIAIRDASMSREHCEILLESGVATVVDRGSMNGTLVNGVKTDRKVLVAGDRIQIGKASLFFEEKRAAAPAAAAAPPAPAPAARPAAQPVVGLDDFSFWRRERGGAVGIIVGVVALGLLAAGAVYVFKSLSGGATIAADPANLLGVTGRFEPGLDNAVIGWGVKQGLASKIHIATGTAKQGKTSLQLDKSGAVNDLVAEVVNLDIFALPPQAGPIEVSAWAKSESANILPAIKATWLAARAGPVLLEEASEPAPGAGDWIQLAQSFSPPAGATHVQLSLIAVGRAGRVYFDDVKAKFSSGGSGLKTVPVGDYSLGVTPVGSLIVTAKDGRRILHNVQILLASDKEGVVHQVAAMGARIQVDEAARKLTIAGKIPSPVDLRPIDFEVEARPGKESLLLGYQLRGDALKQIDRVGVTLLLPGTEQNPRGDYANPVSKLWFRSASGDYQMETDGLMRVSGDWVPQARRSNLQFVTKNVSEITFSFSLKPGAGGLMDPIAAAKLAQDQGRPQEAFDILTELLAATREDTKRESIRLKMKELEDIEAADWQTVQSHRFMAELVGLKPYFETALQKLDAYDKRWSGGKRAEASKAERAKLTTGIASAAEDRETIRAGRLLDRAEEHFKEGRRPLARELCETVRRHYGQTSAAVRAAELLKKLGSE